MKILVIGGMHGNEPLGLEVVRLLRMQSAANIDTLLANEQAIKADCRFVLVDLNRSFPGSPTATDYETRRAAEVLQACDGYDLVLDFHNTHCPDNDCTFIGSAATGLLYDVSNWLGLKRVIVADYDCLNKYATNCISIEISLASKRMDAEQWVGKITSLAQRTSLPKSRGLELYAFVYRITNEDRDRLGLRNMDLRAFHAIPPKLARELGVQNPAYPIFLGDGYTPYNYGGVLNRITDIPDGSRK